MTIGTVQRAKGYLIFHSAGVMSDNEGRFPSLRFLIEWVVFMYRVELL